MVKDRMIIRLPKRSGAKEDYKAWLLRNIRQITGEITNEEDLSSIYRVAKAYLDMQEGRI